MGCHKSLPYKKSASLYNENKNNIINGVDVTSDDVLAKSIVGVYDPITTELCTGTLIAKNVVLTAAHCIGPEPEKMVLVFDTVLTDKSKMIEAESVSVSPYWEANKNNEVDTGDLAIISFSGPTPKHYSPAKILITGNAIKNRETVVYGFGINNVKEFSGAGTLRKTLVDVADPNYSTTEVKIAQNHGTGACHGDSGGPAFVKINNTYYLWGTVARGIDDPEDQCNTFAAYTNVTAYRTWIYRKIKSLEESLVDRQL